MNQLRALGLDVEWVGDWPSDPGDVAILGYAFQSTRILVTVDKDFGDLVFARRYNHAGVIRIANDVAFYHHAEQIRNTLLLHAAQLQRGAFVTISPGRMRVTVPPRGSSPH